MQRTLAAGMGRTLMADCAHAHTWNAGTSTPWPAMLADVTAVTALRKAHA